jgi:Icc-related predicted phosphoesterase
VRRVRIGAISDVHLVREDLAEIRAMIREVNQRADVLCVCGDMTTHGTAEQMRAFCGALADVDCPVVAVLGNHDCYSGAEAELGEILRERGIHLLDASSVVIDGVGFAGVKGFGGGFGDHLLDPFGEGINKEYAGEAINEATRLRRALAGLGAEYTVVVLHYAPIPDTLRGEPHAIYPFLGSHGGSPHGRTPAGIPVFNVAYPVMKASGERCRIWTAAPDGAAGERTYQGGER